MSICELEQQLNEQITSFEEGRRIWKELSSKYSIDDGACVLIFSSTDNELNYTSLLYLEQLMEQKEYTRALLLTCDDNVAKYGMDFCDKIEKIITFSRDAIVQLLKFYIATVNVTEYFNSYIKNVYFCDLKQPPMRDFETEQRICQISLAEVVCYWIYGMSSFEKKDGAIQKW